MTSRSSLRLPSIAVMGAVLGACGLQRACAPGPHPRGAAQLSAADLPELGDEAPAPVVKHPAKPAPHVMLARLDLDTPVGRLCADPRAKAVLDTDLPGLTTRPEYPFFKSMSLNTLKKMSHGKMSDADLAKVRDQLAQIEEPPPEMAAK